MWYWLWAYVTVSAIVMCIGMAIKPPTQWQKPEYDWADRAAFAVLGILLLGVLLPWFAFDAWRERRKRIFR